VAGPSEGAGSWGLGCPAGVNLQAGEVQGGRSCTTSPPASPPPWAKPCSRPRPSLRARPWTQPEQVRRGWALGGCRFMAAGQPSGDEPPGRRGPAGSKLRRPPPSPVDHPARLPHNPDAAYVVAPARSTHASPPRRSPSLHILGAASACACLRPTLRASSTTSASGVRPTPGQLPIYKLQPPRQEGARGARHPRQGGRGGERSATL